jgi:hypothetical protein
VPRRNLLDGVGDERLRPPVGELPGESGHGRGARDEGQRIDVRWCDHCRECRGEEAEDDDGADQSAHA